MSEVSTDLASLSAVMNRKPTSDEVGQFVEHPELVQQVDEQAWAVPFYDPLDIYLVCFINPDGNVVIAASEGYVSHSTKSIVLMSPVPLGMALQKIGNKDAEFAHRQLHLFEEFVTSGILTWCKVDF